MRKGAIDVLEIAVMENEEYAGHFFGRARIKRKDAPFADGALNRYTMGEIGKIVIG
jgi:hypothetical protein